MNNDVKNRNSIVHVRTNSRQLTPKQFMKINRTPLKIRAYSLLIIHLIFVFIAIIVIRFLLFCFVSEFMAR